VPKILFVMPYFIKDNRGGGAEVQAYLKAKHLAQKEGLEVIYLTSNPGDKPQEETVEGIRVLRKLRMPFPLRNTFTIFREILRIKPCIVYTRMNWPAVLPIGLASKIIKARTLWFATEDAPLQPWFNFRSVLSALKDYKKTKIKLVPLLINAFFEDLFFNLGLRLMDEIYAQNKTQKQLLRKNFGRDAKIFKSIHEIPETEPKKSPRPMVLWAGSFGKRKRPEIFIEIARRLPQYEFVMIGRIKENQKEFLKNAPPNLQYAGYVPFDESEKFFESAWVYVNTSEKGREGFPNTFIQAWKHKTAVVSMNADPDGLLSEKGLGILTDDDLEKTVEAIRKLVDDENLRKKISHNAYFYTMNKHNIKNLMALFKLKNCYK